MGPTSRHVKIKDLQSCRDNLTKFLSPLGASMDSPETVESHVHSKTIEQSPPDEATTSRPQRICAALSDPDL